MTFEISSIRPRPEAAALLTDKVLAEAERLLAEAPKWAREAAWDSSLGHLSDDVDFIAQRENDTVVVSLYVEVPDGSAGKALAFRQVA